MTTRRKPTLRKKVEVKVWIRRAFRPPRIGGKGGKAGRGGGLGGGGGGLGEGGGGGLGGGGEGCLGHVAPPEFVTYILQVAWGW